jgi:outer membrane protein TolC
MKNSKSLIISLFVFLISSPSYSQSDNDTTVVSFDSYIELVKAYHPIARQGELLLESGEVNLKKARGNFDPVIKSVYDQKQFDGKNYFQNNYNELKIPTPLGLELKAGYDYSQGDFINPESSLPENGLAYAGIALPLGNGLFFDERRQAVRQAEVFERATVLEQILLINQLIFDATKAYWDWQAAWNTYEIFDEAVRLAIFRFEGVKSSFEQGDVPAIDTLEAFILVQNRQLSRNNAMIVLQQAKLDASNFLWSENTQPMVLSESAIPIEHTDTEIGDPSTEAWLGSMLMDIEQLHPKILLYFNKLENLDFERRMKVEKVKPKLNINYNFLNQPVGGNPFEGYSTNDYKWGFEFSMPLLLRQGRGDLQLTKIKMSQTDIERQNETLKIKNKIKAYHIEIGNLYGQIELYQNTVNNYFGLLNGEKRKFEEGESSLFLVNSRENSLINAEVKLIELIAKYRKAQAGLEYSTGGFSEDI